MLCQPKYKITPNIQCLPLLQHRNKTEDCCVYSQGLPVAVAYRPLKGFHARQCLPEAEPSAPVWMLTWSLLRKQSSSTACMLLHRYMLLAPCGYNSIFSRAEEAAKVVRKALESCIHIREFSKWKATSLFSYSTVLKPQLTLKLVQYSHLLCFELTGKAMIWAHDAHTLKHSESNAGIWRYWDWSYNLHSAFVCTNTTLQH